ncbi:MAG: SRPBCC family protein [Bacteroidota bacterium]
MRYTTVVEINCPIDQVVEFFDSQENYPHWMEGLVRHTVVSGTFGQPGTKSELEFQLGKRGFKMTEQVLERNFPAEYLVRYQTPGVENLVKSKFQSTPEGKTKYLSENEFQFKGFMKIIAWLMPGSFKKQSLKYQTDFKQFVERNTP